MRQQLYALRGGQTAAAPPKKPSTAWSDLTKALRTLRTVADTFSDVPHKTALVTALVALTLAVSAVGVVFSYLSRDFWEALSAKDTVLFSQLVRKFFVALAVGTPLIGLHEYIKVSHRIGAQIYRYILGSESSSQGSE